MISGNTVTLIDGRTVDDASEEWKHECAARHILNLPTKKQREELLALIEKKSGKPHRDSLVRTIRQIWLHSAK